MIIALKRSKFKYLACWCVGWQQIAHWLVDAVFATHENLRFHFENQPNQPAVVGCKVANINLISTWHGLPIIPGNLQPPRCKALDGHDLMFLALGDLPFRHLRLIIKVHVEDLRYAEHLSGKSGDKHGDRSCCWEQKSIWRRSSNLGGTKFSTHNPRPLEEEANTATRGLWLRCDGLETHAEDAIFTPAVCVGFRPSTPAVTMWFWHSNHCQESRTLWKASVTKDKDPVLRYYSSVPFQTASVLWTSFKKAILKWTKGGFPFKPTSTRKSRKEKSQPCFRLHKLMVRVELECPSPLQRRNTLRFLAIDFYLSFADTNHNSRQYRRWWPRGNAQQWPWDHLPPPSWRGNQDVLHIEATGADLLKHNGPTWTYQVLTFTAKSETGKLTNRNLLNWERGPWCSWLLGQKPFHSCHLTYCRMDGSWTRHISPAWRRDLSPMCRLDIARLRT